MPGWLLVLLAIGATLRLTHLINADYVTGWLRSWAMRRDAARAAEPMEPGEVGPREYFVTCPWCVSMYAGAAVAALTVLWPDNRVLIGVWLALTASYVTGWVESR